MTTKVTALTASDFATTVDQQDQPVLVDFYADWCGPCKMVAPLVEELANELDGQAIVRKVNIDQERELAAQFGVRSIPTFLVFKNGELADTLVGAQPKAALAAAVSAHV